MAVEAHHLHLFSQPISNREIANAYGATSTNLYSIQMAFGTPGAGILTPAIAEPILAAAPTTVNPSDSGLTCNLPAPRKRPRELISSQALPISNGEKERNPDQRFSFLGEDISYQILQQHLEIDRFISQHTDKVRRELAERRKRHTQQLLLAFELRMYKRLKAKEEEIEKMGKLNWALEEKVRSLNVENQIWRDLAQASEATATALRSNLEQVLAQVRSDQGRCEMAGDAESCCSSSSSSSKGSEGEGERRKVAEWGEGVKDKRWCRSCGKEESRVLLLPCRHLCVCATCVASVQTCPVCNCSRKGSLHVNLS